MTSQASDEQQIFGSHRSAHHKDFSNIINTELNITEKRPYKELGHYFNM